VQKGKKFVTFALISTYGTTMDLHKEGVNGGRYEKVTVISSVVHTYIGTYQAKLEVGNGISAIFFVTEEAGNALAALGNIHEDDGHILK
jgi:hypothetical protein